MNMSLILCMFFVLAATIGITLAALRSPGANTKSILRSAVILLAADLILLYSADLALFCFTLYNQTSAPIFGIALAEIFLTAGVLLFRDKQKRPHRFFQSLVKIVCLTLLLELAVFCGKCYTSEPYTETKTMTQVAVEFSNQAAEHGNAEIIISGNSDLTFTLNEDQVRYLTFDLESEDTFYQMEVFMTDENFAYDPKKAGHTWVNASQNTVTFPMKPYGTLHQARVMFRDVNEHQPVHLTAITTSNVKPYSFSFIRMLLLIGMLALISAIRIFEWYKITYNRRNFQHRSIILAVLLLCLSGTYWILPTHNAKLSEYTVENGVGTYDPYAQTFDAWQRGQVHLNLEVDPLLAELENPYDRSARDESGAASHWDKAFYNGKYYSYFGIAPVVFAYYPIYLLTGKIPETAYATSIFAMISVIFLFGFFMAAIRKYGKHVNFLLLLCGLIAANAASGIYICANYADRYCVAIISGICFLYLFLWLGLEATMAKRQISRALLLAGCGLAISACVLSRPTLALYAVLLIPPFLALIRRKDLKISQKSVSVTCFAVPLLIGAAVTMAYNAARFSSPLDFGSTYQLTVSNTAANQVSLSEFPIAMVFYFLCPLSFGKGFPFLHTYGPAFSDTTHYIYIEAGYGAFVFLFILAAMLLLVPVTRTKYCRTEQRWVFRLAFLMTILLALIDFCVGGFVTRYLCDILPILSVFSALVLLEAQRQLQLVPNVYGIFSRTAAVLMLLAPVVVLITMLASGEQFSIWKSDPEFYFELRDLVVFWR